MFDVIKGWFCPVCNYHNEPKNPSKCGYCGKAKDA